MPKCPKCGQHINQLNLKSIEGGAIFLDEEGEIQTEWNSDTYGEEFLEIYASCPECGKKLFDADDYQKATDFLRRK